MASRIDPASSSRSANPAPSPGPAPAEKLPLRRKPLQPSPRGGLAPGPDGGGRGADDAARSTASPVGRESSGGEPGEQEAPAAGRGSRMLASSWAVSMIVHVIVLLAMALIVGTSEEIVKPTLITSTVSDEEEISELELDEAPQEPAADIDEPVMEVATTPEVSFDAVVPVEAVAMTDAVDVSAPVAVDIADLSADLLPQAGMADMSGAAAGMRGRGDPGSLAVKRGGGADTEAAVARALKWLAIHQMPDGGWSFDLTACPNCAGKCSGSGMEVKESRAGATALALLPFLGHGNTHRQGPYKKQVAAGMAFLVQRAIEGKGRIYSDFEAERPAPGQPAQNKKALYSQGVAGIALAECYAMTRDEQLAAPTQAVLDFSMKAQDPRGGGWRYHPGEAGDTSVVSWHLMALKSGNMAGLRIDPLAVEKITHFLDSVAVDKSGSLYGYMPGREAKPTCSAAALICRMYLGWNRDHPAVQAAAARMATSGPTHDLYYVYYATQVLHHFGGEPWRVWNAKMKPLLLESQAREGHEAGSWHAGFEQHHDRVAGRLYCTAMATMTLEVYYRHLPLYSDQNVVEKFRE